MRGGDAHTVTEHTGLKHSSPLSRARVTELCAQSSERGSETHCSDVETEGLGGQVLRHTAAES